MPESLETPLKPDEFIAQSTPFTYSEEKEDVKKKSTRPKGKIYTVEDIEKIKAEAFKDGAKKEKVRQKNAALESYIMIAKKTGLTEVSFLTRLYNMGVKPCWLTLFSDSDKKILRDELFESETLTDDKIEKMSDGEKNAMTKKIKENQTHPTPVSYTHLTLPTICSV